MGGVLMFVGLCLIFAPVLNMNAHLNDSTTIPTVLLGFIVGIVGIGL